MDIRTLLQKAIDAKASDIFLEAGLPATIQVDGTLAQINDQRLTPDETQRLVEEIYACSKRDSRIFFQSANHDDDFSFSVAQTGHFRVNVFRQRGTYAAIIRAIPFGLPDPNALHIPESVLHLADARKGLVLVTGPSSAGKSTTLACMVDRMNHTRSGHIITMEDPIEFVHRHDRCIVTQREIPTDVETYAEALASSLREHPDVLLISEMHDSDTIETAMTAAEVAQLVFSTLHTISASDTIDRIINSFPHGQQHQVRILLSTVIEAIVSQQLVPAVDGSLVPAFEILIATPAIRTMIREERSHQIDSIIAAGAEDGMQTMDQSLFELLRNGTITKECALEHAAHRDSLEKRLEIEGLG